ncbi:histone-lysine N-methyltransferase SETMAR-like [Hydra vulgaris]|uniref:Histone-lysine N-methyltransferase SETMAR-like n=1 Tax=Hydra vulgaris TaxID=6087 RepID=A0ABM4C8N4_HYDVU
MEKFEYRAYIKTRALLGVSAQAISDELVLVHGNRAPKYSTVAKWATLFKDGRESLEDDPRSGHPRTTYTAENIERLRAIIKENPHATHDIIEALTSINCFTINEIIHNALKKRKLTSHWIPHELTDQICKNRVEAWKKNLALFRNGQWRLCDVITGDESWFNLIQVGHKSANASWVGEGESPRTIVRCDRFQPKNMFYIFFKPTGVVHLGYVEKGDTITSEYYTKNCLKPLICEINKQRRKTGTQNFKFLHDNARPHVTETVTNCLNQAGITIIRHPPYSPDLAPSDYWLFNLI